MNQILSTNNSNNNKRNNDENFDNNYNYNDYEQNNHNGKKNVLIIFGVVILVFGLLICAFVAYRSISNKQKTQYEPPKVDITEMEEGVKISVESKSGISQIIYYWNDEETDVINANNSPTYEKMIDKRVGENTLNVIVIDGDNKEEKFSQVIENVASEPEIKYENVKNDEGITVLRITATDENEMDYITYSWNGETPQKVTAQPGENTIQTDIEIQRGENTLTIVAVNKDGIETKKSEIPVKASKDPTIDVTKTGDIITMVVEHDMGFKKVEFILNGEIFTYEEGRPGYDSTQSKLEYTFHLKEGENTVTINAYSMEDTEYQYVGQCTYNP